MGRGGDELPDRWRRYLRRSDSDYPVPRWLRGWPYDCRRTDGFRARPDRLPTYLPYYHSRLR